MPSPIDQDKKEHTVDTVQLSLSCPKCKKQHQIDGYLDIDSNKIKELKLPTNPNIGDNDILTCDNCKFELDLKPIKNAIEAKNQRKVSFK